MILNNASPPLVANMGLIGGLGQDKVPGEPPPYGCLIRHCACLPPAASQD